MKRAYTVEQIDAVLGHHGFIREAAKQAGVAYAAASARRQGLVPAYYREALAARAAATRAQKASRFVNVRDARAGR